MSVKNSLDKYIKSTLKNLENGLDHEDIDQLKKSYERFDFKNIKKHLVEEEDVNCDLTEARTLVSKHFNVINEGIPNVETQEEFDAYIEQKRAFTHAVVGLMLKNLQFTEATLRSVYINNAVRLKIVKNEDVNDLAIKFGTDLDNYLLTEQFTHEIQ